jgi:Xaa-Pro dipeptidase
MLTLEGCRARQMRFRERLASEGIDAVVISDSRDIYYFTGLLLSAYPAFEFPAFFYMETDGGSWLAANTDEGEAAVDDRIVYASHVMYTMNPDPRRGLNKVVAKRLKTCKSPGRLGWQQETMPKLLADSVAGILDANWVPIDDLLVAQQVKKDKDEVALLQKAIDINLKAYEAIQEMIAPGVNELDVLAAGQREAFHAAEYVLHHGGDYRCAELGGPARNRAIQAGELYIIDAQTEYHGYWSDLCRTFSVSEPTDLQGSVYEMLAAILKDVPNLVQPGSKGTDLWQTIDARILEHEHLKDVGLIHHAGHGVGIRAHEPPDLNRDREGIFEVGNVFSCEPGAYSTELKGGIRLENTFLVTEDGVKNLTDFPLQLSKA